MKDDFDILLVIALVIYCAWLSNTSCVNLPVKPVTKIIDVAGSECASHVYGNGHGKAPVGFVKLLAATFERSVCRGSKNIGAGLGSPGSDALAFYGATGADRYVLTYSLAFEHGMRESDGRYWLGADPSAVAGESASEAEAGLFQTSYNSLGGFNKASGGELQERYDWYQANPSKCMLDIAKEGLTPGPMSEVGSGPGVTFQRFTKTCPAFAVEYAMIMLRVGKNHYGPIKRKEARFTDVCTTLLTQIKANPNCAEAL